MDIEKMTEALQHIMMKAVEHATNAKNSEISAEHILIAMLEDDGLDGIFERLHLDKMQLLKVVNKYQQQLPSTTSSMQPMLSRYVNEAYNKALDYMKQRGDTYIDRKSVV